MSVTAIPAPLTDLSGLVELDQRHGDSLLVTLLYDPNDPEQVVITVIDNRDPEERQVITAPAHAARDAFLHPSAWA